MIPVIDRNGMEYILAQTMVIIKLIANNKIAINVNLWNNK